MRYNGFLLIDYAAEPSLLFKFPYSIPSYIIDSYKENIKSLTREETIVILNPGNQKENVLHPCLIQYKSEGSGEDYEDWFEVEITET